MGSVVYHFASDVKLMAEGTSVRPAGYRAVGGSDSFPGRETGAAIGVPREWPGEERIMPEAMDLLPPTRRRHAPALLAHEATMPGPLLAGAVPGRDIGR